jgi:hypothetical protein
MRMNKTEKNLRNLWELLDNASGNLYEAMHQISVMTGTEGIKEKHENRIDISAIDGLKDDVEKLMNDKGINLYD